MPEQNCIVFFVFPQAVKIFAFCHTFFPTNLAILKDVLFLINQY